MGAAGAAAPTIFGQWVQAMYYAPIKFWDETTFSVYIMHKHRKFFNGPTFATFRSISQ